MEKGSRVIVINGLFHGFHGEIVDVVKDGDLVVAFDYQDFAWTLTPFDVELEEGRNYGLRV